MKLLIILLLSQMSHAQFNYSLSLRQRVDFPTKQGEVMNLREIRELAIEIKDRTVYPSNEFQLAEALLILADAYEERGKALERYASHVGKVKMEEDGSYTTLDKSLTPAGEVLNKMHEMIEEE